MNKSYIASEIKNRLNMPEMLRGYGFDLKRDRIPCHIHGGKNDNLGIKKEYCHCFKCGYTADVIKFVQDYFSLNFADAVSKLNDDFSLGLPIGERIGKRRQTDIARQMFFKKQEGKNKLQEHEKLLKVWEDAHGELLRLERQKIKYKPTSVNEDLHPLFVEAITNIEHARYKLDCAEEDLMQYEKSNS